MLEYLLIAVMPAVEPYSNASMNAFVAVANNRVVDGIGYGDGRGALSAGIVFSHPAGFFFGSEASAFHGGDDILPSNDVFSVDSFAGWVHDSGNNRIAIEITDYRLFGTSGNAPSYNTITERSFTLSSPGVALRFRRGSLEALYSREFDKPYYVSTTGDFFFHDVERAVITWRQPLAQSLHGAAGLGMVRSLDGTGRHRFVSGSISWQWLGLEWQAVASARLGESSLYAADNTQRSHLVLRVAKSFHVF